MAQIALFCEQTCIARQPIEQERDHRAREIFPVFKRLFDLVLGSGAVGTDTPKHTRAIRVRAHGLLYTLFPTRGFNRFYMFAGTASKENHDVANIADLIQLG